MAPTRSRHRASTSSPSHFAPPSPALISLIETLLTSVPPLPSQVTNSLHSLKDNPASLESQFQLAHSLPHPPLSAPLNLLFSHLTLYHSHHPDLSLPILTSNLTLPPTPPLLPSLSSLSLLTRNPSPQLKSALLHHLPSLLPPLHYLFRHPPTVSQSLIILLNLSSVHPQSLLPYWSLFLPPSKSLTDLLNSPNQILRSHSISTVHNLISGARQLFRNLPLSHTPSSNAFTSTALRALRVARALHLILADALNNESDGVVLAKISKLAALLFNCVSYPAVESHHINPLISALRACLFAETPPDWTSRAAAATAMAAGLMKSGQVVEGIDSLCEDVVCALENEEEEPVVELLGILRGVIRVKGELFVRVWETIRDRLVGLAGGDKGESLHCVRLIETWLKGAVDRALAVGKQGTRGAEIDNSAQDLALTWEVYERVLKEVAYNGNLKVQAVALGAMESVLRLTDCVGDSMGWKIDREIKNNILAGGKHPLLRIMELTNMLQEFALSEYGIVARIAALRSLASTPVARGGEELVLTVLHCFLEVIRKQGNDNGVKGKAMTAAATVMDRVVSVEMEIQLEVMLTFREITTYAVNLLQSKEYLFLEEQSAAARANVESSTIAAIKVITCALRNCDQVQASPDINSAMDEQVNALSRVLQSDTSVNVKCICTRAIGQVLQSSKSHFGVQSVYPEKTVLTKGLERSLEIGDVRLQMACAQVLTKLMNEKPGAFEPFQSLFLFTSVYERSNRRTTAENDFVDNNDRRLLLSLQDVLGEQIYGIVARSNEDLLKAKCSMWTASTFPSVNKTLVDAVFHHLSIPRHLAEYMREPGARAPESERKRSGQLFLDSLNPESRVTVEKVLRMDRQNG